MGSCPICRKELSGKYAKYKTCCSSKCRVVLEYQNRVDRWLNGTESGHKNSANNDIKPFVRKYLLERSRFLCERCGFCGVNSSTGKTILQIHHKDGNSENSTSENLEVICPNCHAMTETYMGLNRGKSSRTSRYGEVE